MKTNLDSLFKVNKDLEKDGIWFELGETSFLIRISFQILAYPEPNHIM